MVDEHEGPVSGRRAVSLAERRLKVKLQIGLGALILLSGIVIGAGGTVIVLRERIAWRDSRRPKRTAEEIAQHIADTYDLSDTQVRNVEAIFAERLQLKQTIRQEMYQRWVSADECLIERMKGVLSTEQFAAWERDFRARCDRHRKHKGGTDGS